MKKFIIAIAMLFGFISSASAAGVNIGISLTAGQFEADGAAEKFTGAHGGSAVPSPGNVTKKASDEGDSAEALFAFPSIFIEKLLIKLKCINIYQYVQPYIYLKICIYIFVYINIDKQ